MITLFIIVMYFVIGMFIGRSLYQWQISKGKLRRYWTDMYHPKRNPKPAGAGLIVVCYAILWPVIVIIAVIMKAKMIPERIGYWVGAGQ